jgi:hypothetical protein
VLWRDTPATFEGRHYRFHDVYLEPKPARPEGPPLWFGGQRLHAPLLRRLVAHGQGFNPLGRPGEGDLERLEQALAGAGRSLAELELVGGTRGELPGPSGVADLEQALAAVPAQLERGFSTICLKPSQFTDDPREVATLCRRALTRLEAFASSERGT